MQAAQQTQLSSAHNTGAARLCGELVRLLVCLVRPCLVASSGRPVLFTPFSTRPSRSRPRCRWGWQWKAVCPKLPVAVLRSSRWAARVRAGWRAGTRGDSGDMAETMDGGMAASKPAHSRICRREAGTPVCLRGSLTHSSPHRHGWDFLGRAKQRLRFVQLFGVRSVLTNGQRSHFESPSAFRGQPRHRWHIRYHAVHQRRNQPCNAHHCRYSAGTIHAT